MKKFVTGPFWVNTWVLCDKKKAIIIDPGGTTEEMMQYLADMSICRIEIMLTHGHFDHLGGVPALTARFPDFSLWIHQNDADYVGKRAKEIHIQSFAPLRADRYIHALQGSIPAQTDFLTEEHQINGFSVIHTPGHTNGSVCFWKKKEHVLFSGDTLFCRSRGRTDLLHGNEMLMCQSLTKLFSVLPDDTVVYPGHGSETSIGAEKQFQSH